MDARFRARRKHAAVHARGVPTSEGRVYNNIARGRYIRRLHADLSVLRIDNFSYYGFI